MGILRAGALAGLKNQPTAQIIAGSLKFQKSLGTNLRRTPGSAGDRDNYTGSVWIKRTQFAPDDTANSNANNHIIFSAGTNSGSNVDDFSYYKNAGNDDNKLRFQSYPGSTQYEVISDAKYRDPSGWYNVTWSYDGTTAKLYVNGERITNLDTNTQNGGSGGHFNNTVQHVIGRTCDLANSGEFDGYMSQFYWIDGQTLEPDSFGFTDPLTNTWRPKKYEGTFGTNGFYLPMDNQDDFEKDKSGNGNDFTKGGFTGTSSNPDVVKDSPSGVAFGGPPTSGITTTNSAPANYCTWNRFSGRHIELADGNLDAESSTISTYAVIPSTIPMTSGKWYAEFTYRENINGAGDGSNFLRFGISQTDRNFQSSTPLGTDKDHGFAGSSTAFHARTNGSNTYTYSGIALADGDIFSLAFDADAGQLWVAKNGTYLTNSGGAGDPANGNNPDHSSLTYSGGYFFVAGPYAGAASPGDGGGRLSSGIVGNWGQKPFKYAVPQGFLPVNSAAVRRETVIPHPERYVGIATYKGSGSTNQIISANAVQLVDGGSNSSTFNPDWIWIADRFTNGGAKWLFDSVRGSDKYLQTTSNGGQGTRTFTINNNGVSIPAGDGSYNLDNSKQYVAFYLKAGGSSNTFNVDDVGYASAAAAGLDGGTINPTGASVGTKQGFSITTITTPSSAGAYTVSHGLTKAPDFIIYRIYDQNMSFYVWHQGYGAANKYMLLNANNAVNSGTYVFNNTLPSATVITDYASNSQHHNEGRAMIYYSWHDVPGLQKFGTFFGTPSGSQDYVHCGFKPAVVWLKRTDSTGNWAVFDTQRNKFNPSPKHVFTNSTADEQGAATGDSIDIVSNGFVVRSTNAYTNTGAPGPQQYIYCAWAEAPTFNLFGGQPNAV